MPQTENKVRYGLKNVHYAILRGANGAITYGTPKRIPGAISLSLSASTARKILAADDTDYWVAESIANYTGDITFARIPDDFRADCLGEETDTNGVRYETSAPITARFALLFEFDGDQYKTRHVLYNCTASRPGIAGQTVNPDDGPDPSQSTETLTLTASANSDVPFIRARCKLGDSAYTDWFTSVYMPEMAPGGVTQGEETP